ADVELVLFRRLLGKADRSDLRRAVSAARDQPLVHGMRLEAFDCLDADDALVLGLVGEQRWTGNVADRVDAGDIRAIERIDRDRAAIGFHAQFFKAEIFDIAGHPNRGDDPLDGKGLRVAFAVVDRRGDAVRRLVELAYLRACEDLNALLLELLAREGGN